MWTQLRQTLYGHEEILLLYCNVQDVGEVGRIYGLNNIFTPLLAQANVTTYTVVASGSEGEASSQRLDALWQSAALWLEPRKWSRLEIVHRLVSEKQEQSDTLKLVLSSLHMNVSLCLSRKGGSCVCSRQSLLSHSELFVSQSLKRVGQANHTRNRGCAGI